MLVYHRSNVEEGYLAEQYQIEREWAVRSFKKKRFPNFGDMLVHVILCVNGDGPLWPIATTRTVLHVSPDTAKLLYCLLRLNAQLYPVAITRVVGVIAIMFRVRGFQNLVLSSYCAPVQYCSESCTAPDVKIHPWPF